MNDTHAVIKNAAPKYNHSFGVEPMVVLIEEFDWTPAGNLHRALAEFATVKQVQA